MENLVVGFLFLFLGAVCNGLFASPSNYVKNFPWENLWGLSFFLTMIVIPSIVFPLILENPWEVYRLVWNEEGVGPLLAPTFFGLLWGAGFVLFAVVISNIGFSLTFAIVYGLIAMFGSLIPLIAFNSDKIPTSGGFVIVLGIGLATLGVGTVGYAGMLRDRPSGAEASTGEKSLTGILILCVLTGFFCACPSLAFAFGGKVAEASEAVGNPSHFAGFSVWILLFLGGFTTAGIYCGWRLTTNKTWNAFSFSRLHAARNWCMALGIAVMHIGIFPLYGIGASKLGELGAAVGWAMQLSLAMIIANVFGFMIGEWRKASGESRKWIYIGIALLVFSTAILGLGNNMVASAF